MLKLAKSTNYGVDANYWKIYRMEIDISNKIATIFLAGYVTKDFNKNPIDMVQFHWEGPEFPFTDSEHNITTTYAKIRESKIVNELETNIWALSEVILEENETTINEKIKKRYISENNFIKLCDYIRTVCGLSPAQTPLGTNEGSELLEGLKVSNPFAAMELGLKSLAAIHEVEVLGGNYNTVVWHPEVEV